jgi:hypothetical protein
MLADPVARRQEAVAEAELNVSYAGSAITAGPKDLPLGAGQRLPTTIALPPGAGAAHLHQLTHRRNHTLLLLADSQAPMQALTTLQAQLEADVAFVQTQVLVEAVVLQRLEDAASLGLGPLTLLAVRPDGFIGLRADADHQIALGHYATQLLGR